MTYTNDKNDCDFEDDWRIREQTSHQLILFTVASIALVCLGAVFYFLHSKIAVVIKLRWSGGEYRECNTDSTQIDLKMLQKEGRRNNREVWDREMEIVRDVGVSAEKQNIRLKELIGRGNFGMVFDAEFIDGEKPFEGGIVVKVLNPCMCSDNRVTDCISTEISLLKEAQSFGPENVIKFHSANVSVIPYWIVMEKLSGGCVLDFLFQMRNIWEKNPMTLREFSRMALDVAKGCEAMEKMNLMHRDLAARNILFSVKNGQKTIKIGDFGMAKELSKSISDTNKDTLISVASGPVVPVCWMPPEVLSQAIFTIKTDVWSFGIYCFELFSLGRLPYKENAEDLSLLKSTKTLSLPPNAPEEMRELVVNCWNENPEERISFVDLRIQLEFILKKKKMENNFEGLQERFWELYFPVAELDTPGTEATNLSDDDISIEIKILD